MPDIIGQIGLDTNEIEQALNRVSQKLGSAAVNATGLNQTMLAAGAAIAIWSKNILDAAERTDKLNQAIQAVSKTLSASDYNTTGGLEGRLKEVDSLLEKLSSKKSLADVTIEKFKDLFGGGNTDAREDAAGTMALQKRLEIQAQLAEKVAQVTKVLEMQRDGMSEAAQLEKTRLDYAEKIGAAYAAGNGALATELHKQQAVTEEIIKQNALLKDPVRKARSAQADEEAKNAIGGLLGDQQNEQIIKDREADRKQKIADMWAEAERGTEGDRVLRDALRADSLRELAKGNRQSASDAATQTAIGYQRQTGNKPFATELEVRQSFLQRKRDAIANHNDTELAEIEQQEKQALRDAYSAESRQTPGQARADRREEHRRSIEASRQEEREKELRRRGENGESSRAIDDQRVKDTQRAKFGAEADIAKREAMTAKAWTQADSTNLKTIAKAYEGGLK